MGKPILFFIETTCTSSPVVKSKNRRHKSPSKAKPEKKRKIDKTSMNALKNVERVEAQELDKPEAQQQSTSDSGSKMVEQSKHLTRITIRLIDALPVTVMKLPRIPKRSRQQQTTVDFG